MKRLCRLLGHKWLRVNLWELGNGVTFYVQSCKRCGLELQQDTPKTMTETRTEQTNRDKLSDKPVL